MTPTPTRATATPPQGPETLIQAFAEPTRMRLMALLLDGETCVCDLTSALEIPQPTASRHLGHLRRAGLVSVRKAGLWSHYSLAPADGAVHQSLLATLAVCRAEMPELAANETRCRASRGSRCC
ncbi:MAG: metalloregulator ArsR/SmtB family transcription factor [Planctomycetota bacterium]|nr:metalloregulator ArsR/SmtB family transcription factor [Planctomycetota bacterium]